MSRLAIALALIAGCSDTFEPHFLQRGEDPIEAIRSFGYSVIEDADLDELGSTDCVRKTVTLRDASVDVVAAHEYIHVQQQDQLGCLPKSKKGTREAIPYLAMWVYNGCQENSKDYWAGRGARLEDMDSALCYRGGPSNAE